METTTEQYISNNISVPPGYAGPVRVRTSTRHSNWASLYALSDHEQVYPTHASAMLEIGGLDGALRSFSCGVDIFIVPAAEVAS